MKKRSRYGDQRLCAASLLQKTRRGWPGIVTLTLTCNLQIWFQNRRQNDRRKSRPLSPQELAALRFNGLQSTPSSDSLASFSVGSGFHHAADPSMSHADYDTARLQANEHQAQQQLFVANTGNSHVSMSQQSAGTTRTSEASSSQTSQEGSQVLSQSFSSSVGYLANRWNLGNSFSSQPNPHHHSADNSLRQVRACPPSRANANQYQVFRTRRESTCF